MSDVAGRTRAGGPVVLVVEDDDLLRGVTTRLLEKRGFRVIGVGGVTAAAEIVEAGVECPDVALVDVHLPDGWGAEVAERLRSARADVAIVYTTGYAQRDPVLAAALRDAEHVVHKPYTGDQLAQVLRKAIGDG